MRWNNSANLLLLATSLAACGSIWCDEGDVDAQIESLVERWDRPDSPGLTLAVLQDGQLVYEDAWGLASLELDVPLATETRLNAASVAKQVTATAVLKLEAEGKLSIDDDVGRYRPELRRYEDTITLRHLLWHTSGLRDVWTLADLAGWLPGDVRTSEQALGLISRQRALNFHPGRAFGYSNSGYVLAAAVVEQVTGDSFADWTHEHLLLPAGMHDTRFLDDHLEIVEGYASAYRWSGHEKGFVKDSLASGAVGSGNLITTAGDLARWAGYLLSTRVGGRPLHSVLGAQGTLRDGRQTGYGFGLFVDTYRGLPTLHHGGNSAGYGAHLLIVPEAGFAVVVLANVTSVNSRRLAEQVTDIYLADQLSSKPTPDRVLLSAEDAQSYVGLYALGAQRLLDVRIADGQLYFFLEGSTPRLMFPAGRHRFTTQEEGVEVTFTAGEDGPMVKVVMSVGSQQFTGKRLKPVNLKTRQLRAYEGRYFSEELETFYSIVATDDVLTVQRLRGADFPLVPIEEDRFLEQPAGGLELRFNRNRFDKIRGFTLSVDRARGISFRRQGAA